EHDHEHDHEHGHGHGHHHDHNLKSAYLHVLADALTSLLAIFALLIGKYLGAVWMDPVMGIVGAILVARWSLGLLRSTSAILLDEQGADHLQQAIREAVESPGEDHIVDLHVWTVGPGLHAAVISIVSSSPRSPDHYKQRISGKMDFVHISVEVNHYDQD
ncbi:MAG: cation diffusion facilitator family transporter, partial [Gammaproteobacteria bacterium]